MSDDIQAAEGASEREALREALDIGLDLAKAAAEEMLRLYGNYPRDGLGRKCVAADRDVEVIRKAIALLTTPPPAEVALPEPFGDYGHVFYSSNQMREYGALCVAQALKARPAEPAHVPTCRCGLPQSHNPHPKAGDPSLEFGYEWVCIPCTVKALSGASRRANEARRELADLKKAPAAPAAALTDEQIWDAWKEGYPFNPHEWRKMNWRDGLAFAHAVLAAASPAVPLTDAARDEQLAAAQRLIDEVSVNGDGGSFSRDIESVARAVLAAASAAAPQWISVAERLPEQNPIPHIHVPVWVWQDGLGLGPEEADFDSYHKQFCGRFRSERWLLQVTHWMLRPMPKPPGAQP